MSVRLGPVCIHRNEQWDLGRAGSLIPLVCVHVKNDGGNSCSRVFCLWKWGVLLRVGRRRLVLERRIDGVIRRESL